LVLITLMLFRKMDGSLVNIHKMDYPNEKEYYAAIARATCGASFHDHSAFVIPSWVENLL
jgi:hypothetical protein